MVSPEGIQASLYVTCIIDQLYPEVGVSVVRVLRKLGVKVDFPMNQTCCGQPLYNSGHSNEAKELAKRVIKEFSTSQYIVVPSGSCAAMFRVFYAHLFEDEPDMQEAAEALSNKVYEFSEFLVNILGVTDMGSTNSGSHTFHTSCHLLRELSVKDPPHELLRNVSGIEVKDLPQSEVCCGFGGTFSVKYPHISEEMLSDKVQNIVSTEADTLVSCDMSCLMNIGGALSRTGSAIKTRHLAEVLDGERS